MASTRYTGPAMTLENMRANGMRTIEATCECGHNAIVDVEALRDRHPPRRRGLISISGVVSVGRFLMLRRAEHAVIQFAVIHPIDVGVSDRSRSRHNRNFGCRMMWSITKDTMIQMAVVCAVDIWVRKRSRRAMLSLTSVRFGGNLSGSAWRRSVSSLVSFGGSLMRLTVEHALSRLNVIYTISVHKHPQRYECCNAEPERHDQKKS